MKKNAIVLVLGIFSLALLAQAKSVEFGFKGGVNVANVSWSGEIFATDQKPVNRLVIGAFASIRVNDSFFIQPEVYYFQNGVRWEWTSGGIKFMDYHKQDYFQIPVLAKLRLVTKGKLLPSLFAGPYGAIKLSAPYVYEVGGVRETGNSENFKSSDFGLVFGGSLDYRVGKMVLILDVRYNLGLAKIYDEEGGSLKNRTLSVMVGIGF